MCRGLLRIVSSRSGSRSHRRPPRTLDTRRVRQYSRAVVRVCAAVGKTPQQRSSAGDDAEPGPPGSLGASCGRSRGQMVGSRRRFHAPSATCASTMGYTSRRYPYVVGDHLVSAASGQPVVEQDRSGRSLSILADDLVFRFAPSARLAGPSAVGGQAMSTVTRRRRRTPTNSSAPVRRPSGTRGQSWPDPDGAGRPDPGLFIAYPFVLGIWYSLVDARIGVPGVLVVSTTSSPTPRTEIFQQTLREHVPLHGHHDRVQAAAWVGLALLMNQHFPAGTSSGPACCCRGSSRPRSRRWPGSGSSTRPTGSSPGCSRTPA